MSQNRTVTTLHTTQADTSLRRRVVVAATLIVGSIVLWWSLAIPAGQPLFYLATLMLGLVWAVGAFASGPIHRGHGRIHANGQAGHLIAPAIGIGLGLLVVFLVGALVVSKIPLLAGPVNDLLSHAQQGNIWLVWFITMFSGVAEELFFRGALYAACPPRYAIALTTVVYAVTTIGSGVPLLVFAALTLGLVTGLLRSYTDGYLAPAITHITWSSGMLWLLPPVLNLMS